ncbi:MAG: hypothetical protein LBL49_04760 [Clostridiales Family XIII bacterium]|jgi:hypothetical protein|nr:hypothetical protein [Clostridiales Family XIII bacterium]
MRLHGGHRTRNRGACRITLTAVYTEPSVNNPSAPIALGIYEKVISLGKGIHIGRVLAAACIVFMVVLGTTLALNKELRTYTISFFKSEQIETRIGGRIPYFRTISFFKSEQIETPIVTPSLAAPFGSNQRGVLSTCVSYNLKTGEVRDVISEAGIELNEDTQVLLSPDENTILVNDPHTIYLIDVEKATAKELTEISALDELNVSAGFIDNDMLSVWQYIGGKQVEYTGFSYNLKNGEKTIIFENIPYYSHHPDSTGVYSLGKGITVLVESERYVFIDGKTGVRYTVPDLKPDASIEFSLSPDGKRIAVTAVSGQNGLGITQLGYINIEKQEFKIFDRNDFSGNYETSTFWVNDNEFAITADNENSYLYIYRFE